ncbi:NADPH-dependent FMN reductase [Salinicola peritrichatus]|uniref:NADPH-dependent FMN reductase n=1 Tax=Salinicola peritrichatus TaxID=1267424 RepID=UPI000DA18772|nr:NADPH-dependent FMN reductase [Salinicola peritrichatus]
MTLIGNTKGLFMNIVTLAGSPGASSRSTAMLDYVKHSLVHTGATVSSFRLDDFDANTLVQGRWNDPTIVELRQAVATADALVIATPVYQASFSGGLKLMLDVLPQGALKHKTVLSLAAGGSDQHLLVLDYALKPVLSSLGAYHQLAGIYACPFHIEKDEDGEYRLGKEIRGRLDLAITELSEVLSVHTSQDHSVHRQNKGNLALV